MKRKLFSAILFGAFLTASTSGLTSCKDYDDDISNLQSQIDKLATAEQLSAKVSEMQAAIAAAQSAAEAKAAAAQTVADAASKAADAAAAAASKAQGTADDAAKAAAAAAEVGKAAQAAVDKLAAEAATKAELEAAKDAAAAAVKAIQDAHATDKAAIEKAIADSKDELLKKINENAAALAALDTRLTAVEAQLKAIIDGEGGETSLEAIADEVEAISDALADLIGAFTMATSIDIYNGVDGYDNGLNFWKVKEAVTAEFPREANAKEADGEAYAFKTGTERVYEDSVLVRVNPVDATLDAEHIVLLNSQGAEISSDLVECVEARAYESSNPLTRVAGNGTGLWVVKFKATDKLLSDKDVQKEFKAATELGNKKILFALGTDESYEAAEVDRRLVTAYALTMSCKDAKRASDFKVNDIAVAQIRNRFKTSEDGVQVPKDVYEVDYKWRYIDEDNKKNPVVNTKIVTPAEDKDNYNVVDDNRQDDGEKVLVAEVGQSITISFPTDKPIKGFYVTLDYKRAIESAASEINAWNTYEYENVAKINKKGEVIEPATLQNGNVGYIQVNDLKDYASVGDVIGFRVFAVNLDGTLVDPDGQAFYVGFGESEEVADEKKIAAQTIEVKYAAEADKKNITDFIDVEDAFSGVTFDKIAWTASEGADEETPSVGNTAGNIRITYYKADKKTAIEESEFGKNGIFWEDVKYIKAEIAEPTYLVDDATYTLTATLGVKVGNSSYKVRTVTMPLTKKMPTTLPDGKTIQFNLFQGTEQLAYPGTNDEANYKVNADYLKEGAYNDWGQWQDAGDEDNDEKAVRGKWGLNNIGTTFSGSSSTIGLSTYVDLNNIYVFSDETRLDAQGASAPINFVVKSIAANTGADKNHKNLLDVDATYTAETSVKATFAGNFVNNGSYNVDATYTYADISHKLCDKATGEAPKSGVTDANKIWSNYADGDDGDFANGKGDLSNDYKVAIPAPAIKLMAWSTLGDKYMQYKWREKCIEAGSDDNKTAAKWAVDNEFELKPTITIGLDSVYTYFGTMVKELVLNTGGQNTTLGALLRNNNLKVSKTGSAFATDGSTVKDNIYTKATIGGRTQTNPVFTPTISGSEVTLKRINTNPVEDHKETLYIETIDCFGHKEVVALDFYVKATVKDAVTCANTGADKGKKYRKAQ